MPSLLPSDSFLQPSPQPGLEAISLDLIELYIPLIIVIIIFTAPHGKCLLTHVTDELYT